MPKINSLEVVHQDTNKDSYQNLHDILVDLNKSLALNKEVVDKDARVSIENLLEMYVNDKEAFLRSVLTLTAKFKESQAQFSEEIMLRASELEALAKHITILSAEVKQNSASIIRQDTVRVTDQEAFAQALVVLNASIADANAAIIDEATVRAAADEATASTLTSLTATVGSKNRTYYQSTAPVNNPPAIELVSGDLWINSTTDKLSRYNGSSWVDIQDNEIAVNTAAILSEASARATADSANATAINGVTARLDTGDFAAVKTESSATATKVGNIEAKWGVTTNVNGYVAGIQLLNGGSTSSSFTVDATKFIVKKPNGTNGIEWNGSNSALTVSGDVYANNFYGTGVIGTTNVATHAITTGSSASGGTTPISIGITTSGGTVFLWARGLVWTGDVAHIVRDSSVFVDNVAGSDSYVSLIGVDTPSAGYHTYTFMTEQLTGAPGYYPVIMALETKR